MRCLLNLVAANVCADGRQAWVPGGFELIVLPLRHGAGPLVPSDQPGGAPHVVGCGPLVVQPLVRPASALQYSLVRRRLCGR